MDQKTVKMSTLGALALVIGLGGWWQAQAQNSKAPYASMAPLDQYLMADRSAEIAMARSAAPAAISNDAEVRVLTRYGYETAVKGKNGFVCVVERAWMSPFSGDFAANFWNPKIRAPICFNPPAARSILPITYKRTELVLAGQSKTQIIDRIKTFIKQELPPLEPGAMAYMLSREQYLTDDGDHNFTAHLMFYTPLMDGRAWGADLPALSRHAESTVRRRSRTNRRIHGSHGQMVGSNGSPSQVGVPQCERMAQTSHDDRRKSSNLLGSGSARSAEPCTPEGTSDIPASAGCAVEQKGEHDGCTGAHQRYKGRGERVERMKLKQTPIDGRAGHDGLRASEQYGNR